MMFRGSSVIVLHILVAFVHGLTEEETLNFGTTGLTEHNTGLVGWVTVVDLNDRYWRIEANGIPDHDTGLFPNPNTRANPNPIEEQAYSYRIAKTPEVADESTCLPMGLIGIAVNGVAMYNPWDSEGDNAVEGEGAETFDHCDGHPDSRGRYHYHRQPSSCLFTVTDGEPSSLVGVAFDGFPIYGPIDENGQTLTSSDLDECHGRYNTDGNYQYHTTADFPYILGCFRGTPVGINTDSDKCYKAADTDSQGNLIAKETTTPATTQTTTPAPTTAATTTAATTVSSCRNPNSRRCRNRGKRAVPVNARVPRNLFARRLPASYNAFLQNAIFGRRKHG